VNSESCHSYSHATLNTQCFSSLVSPDKLPAALCAASEELSPQGKKLFLFLTILTLGSFKAERLLSLGPKYDILCVDNFLIYSLSMVGPLK